MVNRQGIGQPGLPARAGIFFLFSTMS